jgi:hypothetical protein
MAGKRVTFYISEELNDSISLVSSRMGISKSILIDKLLQGPMDDLVGLLAMVPEKPTGADVLKFKGRSRDIVNQRVSELNNILGASAND